MTNELALIVPLTLTIIVLFVLWTLALLQNNKNKAGWKQCIRISNGHIKENQKLSDNVEYFQKKLEKAEKDLKVEKRTWNLVAQGYEYDLNELTEELNQLNTKVCVQQRVQESWDRHKRVLLDELAQKDEIIAKVYDTVKYDNTCSQLKN